MPEPTSQPFIDLLREVVSALERTTAELRRLEDEIIAHIENDEKRYEDVRADMVKQSAATSSEVRRMTDQLTVMTTLWKAEQEAEKVVRDTNRKATERREKAVIAVWQNPAVQLLLTGVVLFILQMFGLSWYVSHYFPEVPIPVVAPQVETHPTTTPGEAP